MAGLPLLLSKESREPGVLTDGDGAHLIEAFPASSAEALYTHQIRTYLFHLKVEGIKQVTVMSVPEISTLAPRY